MRDRIAITISINGADEIYLGRRADPAGVSIPTYVLAACCGYETWRLDAARDRPARAERRRPVRWALERRSVTIWVTPAQYADLKSRAGLPNGPGLSVPQFIRTLCGLQVRWTSGLHTEARDREIEDAEERLKALGLDSSAYFRDGEY